jgi:xylulokinase
MSALTCGVDIGSTNVKVILVDERARAVWTKAVPTPRVSDDSGVATDVRRLVAMIEEMIIEGWRGQGQSLPLQAIAVVGVGEDGVGVRSDLTPLGLALPWFDERAAMQASVLQRNSRYAAQAGLTIDPSRTAAKWLWLRQNRPSDLQSAAFWITVTDYPAVAWTGRAFISETLAARTGCYDVYARCWIEPLLTAAGAPTLPPVVPAGTALGSVKNGAATRERSGVHSDRSCSRWTRSSNGRRRDPAVESRRSGGLDGNGQFGLRRNDKRGRTEAQSLPGLFGGGDGQRWPLLPRRL